MNKLETSFFLEKKLKEAKCSKELKSEILKFIEYRHDIATMHKPSDVNIGYRMDLQYLLESIGVDDEALEEAMYEINKKSKEDIDRTKKVMKIIERSNNEKMKLSDEFYNAFNMHLSNFIHKLFGFNLVKFDQAIIKMYGNYYDGNTSLHDFIYRRFGAREAELIDILITIEDNSTKK